MILPALHRQELAQIHPSVEVASRKTVPCNRHYFRERTGQLLTFRLQNLDSYCAVSFFLQ